MKVNTGTFYLLYRLSFKLILAFSILFFSQYCTDDKTSELLVPTIITQEAYEIGASSVKVDGEVIDSGSYKVTNSGVYWNIETNPEITGTKQSAQYSDAKGSFTLEMSRLTGNTMYYVTAYAENEVGEGLGNEITFTTLGLEFNSSLNYDSIIDIEGNIYKTIQIGEQKWMAENLKSTKFNDGTVIPMVTDHEKWKGLTTPAYCWYHNDSVQYVYAYGALYNWYTINTGNLCPSGFHIPNNEEWEILIDFLGGEQVAGGKLKEIGTTHWWIPNMSATNQSGFTGIAGGVHNQDGFTGIGYSGHWWTTDTLTFSTWIGYAWGYMLTTVTANIDLFQFDKKSGLSIRCIKD